MHDAGPFFAELRQSGTPRNKGVDERIVPMSRRGVNNESRGLVENDDFRVFVDHIQVDPVRADLSYGLFRRNPHLNRITARQTAAGPTPLAVDRYPAQRNNSGSLGSRQIELVGEKPIESFGFVNGDLKGTRFVGQWNGSAPCWRGAVGFVTPLVPEYHGKGDRTTTHRDVRNVECWPPIGANTDIDKIHNAPTTAHAVDEIANGATTNQPERHQTESLLWFRLQHHHPQDDQRDDGECGEQDP